MNEVHENGERPSEASAARAKVSHKRMVILVSLAGPIMNLLQALAYSVLLIGLLTLGVYGTGHELADASTNWIATNICENQQPWLLPGADGDAGGNHEQGKNRQSQMPVASSADMSSHSGGSGNSCPFVWPPLLLPGRSRFRRARVAPLGGALSGRHLRLS